MSKGQSESIIDKALSRRTKKDGIVQTTGNRKGIDESLSLFCGLL